MIVKQKADKTKEKTEITSFAGKSNGDFNKYFYGMLDSEAHPNLFNAVIDLPSNGLYELQYCKPKNSMIALMENSLLYKKYKIKRIIASRESVLRDRDLSDTDSEYSLKYGKDGFGKSKQLSSDTLNEFCEILPCCVPFNNQLHIRKQHKHTANCWCPCSPSIWTWLVAKVPSLRW